MFFDSRSATNGPVSTSGSFPVNYPNTWLRLKRAGNVLSGFGGFDGQNWTQLGSVTLALPPSIYFGLVVSSHNTNQVTTAAFRDLAPVNAAGTNGPLSIELLGQCSRRTSLVLSEIMYHPTNSNLSCRVFQFARRAPGPQRLPTGRQHQLELRQKYCYPGGG